MCAAYWRPRWWTSDCSRRERRWLTLRCSQVRSASFLVSPPWFDAQLTELGSQYFASAGLDVVAAKETQICRV